MENFDNSKSFWPNDQMTAGWAFCKSHVVPLQVLCKSHFSPILKNGLTTDLKRTWNGGRVDTCRGKVFCSFVVVLFGVMAIMIISCHISVFWLLQSNSAFFWGIMWFFVVKICRIETYLLLWQTINLLFRLFVGKRRQQDEDYSLLCFAKKVDDWRSLFQILLMYFTCRGKSFEQY